MWYNKAMKIIFVSLIFLIFPFFSIKANIANNLSGRILLSVEEKGEAWYVNPLDLKRYYLGRPTDAFSIMRTLGLGISNSDWEKLEREGETLEMSKKYAGRILLQVEQNGEAWYINPLDLKKHYLGRPADAFEIMRTLGLGISRQNLAMIYKPGLTDSINQYSNYRHEKLTLNGKSFSLDIVEIDLNNPNLEILTLSNAKGQASSLADYVFDNNGFAGLTGSYFCTSSACGGNNYYFFPIYDSNLKTFINEDNLKYWTTGPLIAFDHNNRFYYFKDSRDFKSQAYFEESKGVKLQALIGNKPSLLEKGLNTLIDWEVDASQLNSQTRRNAIAFKEAENKLYLVSVRPSDLNELVKILQYFKFDYALNIDGGQSSALIYNGEYMVRPGRNIPNAIVFKE